MAEDRAIRVTTAKGDELIVTALRGHDEISQGFVFELDLVGTAQDVKPEALLGRGLAVEAEAGDPQRWFYGLVSTFRLVRVEERRAFYAVELRPWLWLLGLTTDCRIFQNLSVVEIVAEIFGKYPEARFEKRLQGIYSPREYCVQIDETDLDFVQRLLEHEGIFYFFEYAEDGHTLVLADDLSQLRSAPGAAEALYQNEATAGRRDRDYLREWLPASSLRPRAFVHTDYDFEKPALSLLAKLSGEPQPQGFVGEHYRQPGAHLDLARGDALARLRLDELQASHLRVRASGTVRGLAAGRRFALRGYPREDQNTDYVVLRADYHLVDPEYESALAGAGGETFWISILAAPAKAAYRPPRTTPRPVMRGPQTATVVGPAGEEIFTDRYGRVKVQFHWDRLGKRDENSSCFIRVSQAWAGAGWGFVQVPRIGQEVIVDFLEGDPDRPIVTGRVYNAAETPPYGLPASASQSGWKSNSTPGGGGWNELRFEDKAGSEQVYFQAQKDHQLLVKNDRAKLVQHDQSDRIDNNAKHSVGVNLDEDVGKNKTTQVGVDRTVAIGSNDSETVGLNRSLGVGSNETISIGANSTETIGANHSQTVAVAQAVTVGAARVDAVGASETRTVGTAQTISVGATRQVSVGQDQSHAVGASDSWSVGAGQTVSVGEGRSTTVGKDDVTEVGGARALKIAKGSVVEIGADGAVKVGKSLVIDAADSIVLKCGSAAIAMKKDGTITIEGKDITVNGSKITVKASGDIVMKGSAIKQN